MESVGEMEGEHGEDALKPIEQHFPPTNTTVVHEHNNIILQALRASRLEVAFLHTKLMVSFILVLVLFIE